MESSELYSSLREEVSTPELGVWDSVATAITEVVDDPVYSPESQSYLQGQALSGQPEAEQLYPCGMGAMKPPWKPTQGDWWCDVDLQQKAFRGLERGSWLLESRIVRHGAKLQG